MISLPFQLHVVLDPRRPANAATTCAYTPPTPPSSATVALGVLLAVSEALPLTTRVKANGILDAVKLFAGAVASSIPPPPPPPPQSPLSLALLPQAPPQPEGDVRRAAARRRP